MQVFWRFPPDPSIYIVPMFEKNVHLSMYNDVFDQTVNFKHLLKVDLHHLLKCVQILYTELFSSQ